MRKRISAHKVASTELPGGSIVKLKKSGKVIRNTIHSTVPTGVRKMTLQEYAKLKMHQIN